MSTQPLQALAGKFADAYAARAADPARALAAERFRAEGLPTPRVEAWHYTPLAALADVALAAPARDPAVLAARIPDLGVPRLVFGNGRYRADLSTPPADLAVRTGAPAWGVLPEGLQHHLVALNTMFAEDGAEIVVPPGTDAGVLMLVHLATGGASHPRHAVRLGANARLTLVEIALGEGAAFHNPVITFAVGEGATVVHTVLQEESAEAIHLATVFAEVAKGATYDSFLLTLGGRLARREMHTRLAGPGAAAHLNAAQLLGGTQHADFTTDVVHASANATSRQTVKNVLAGHARGVFQGRILVERDAQKTDGYQMNQGLLLSPTAELDVKPGLEIYADDVKCSHGTAIGEIDPEQLFYLRSRGIPEGEARAMLVRAFIGEALDGIAFAPVRAAMEERIGIWWEAQQAS